MKRMSEVFELPLAGEENQGEPFLADSTCYFASFDDSMTWEDGKGLERAQHAAHAINSCAALADALEDVVKAWRFLCACNGYDEDHLVEFENAKKALQAYRGAK